ncbi:MAG: hypothetical protein QXS81_04255, partial [Candidatus Micrarchaeaceae archaeon]
IANQIGTFQYTFNTTGNTNYTAKSLSVSFSKLVPLTFYNITPTGALATNPITAAVAALSTYYPYKLFAQAYNGITYTLNQTINGKTTTLIANSTTMSYIPPDNQLIIASSLCLNLAAGTCNGTVEYTQATTLTGNVIALQNIIINPGVTVVSNGYYFEAGYEFDNKGTIRTGIATVGGSGGTSGGGSAGISITTSYAGSGGGGGGAYGSGGSGGSTLVAGGSGGSSGSSGGAGAAGSTPTPPTLTNSEIQTLSSNIYAYLSGASGGGGAEGEEGDAGGAGGAGAYGIFIKAPVLIAGTINASGSPGVAGIASSAGGGGGGGGVILLVYTTNYTKGTYFYSGGSGGSGSTSTYTGGAGGAGGAGEVLTYKSTTAPSIQYAFQEQQNSNKITLKLNLTILTMQSISSFSTNPSTCIQYLPCLATAAFTAKPTSWNIVVPNEPLTNQHKVNTSAGAQFDSPNLTISNFANDITLTYGQFSPTYSFQLNATNNPSVPINLTQTAFKVITSATTPAAPYTRKIDNITGYSESSKSKMAVNFTISSSYSINNYTLSNSSILASSNIGVYIPSSTYQNPPVTQTDLSIIGSDTGVGSVFYDAINSYCPSVVTTAPTNYNIYTVNTNGSLYTFTVYRGYSQTLTNTYMKVLGGTSQSSSVVMQTFKINSNPYSVPLVNGQPYSFSFFNCTQAIYQTNFSVWGNPITLYLPLNVSVPPYLVPNLQGTCLTKPYASGESEIVCSGKDPSGLTKKWSLQISNVTTLLSSYTITTQYFNGSSFNYTYAPIANTSEYHVLMLAYTGNAIDPTYTVLSWYNLVKYAVLPSVAANAWLALLMMFSAIAIGSRSPAMSLLFESIFMFIIPALNIAPIPTAILYGAMALGVLGAFLVAKRYVYGT